MRAVKVVQLGVGMAATLIAKSLRELGATVHRIPPAAGDPFQRSHPVAHAAWTDGIETVSAEQTAALLGEADVCIVGGEDFPGLEQRFDPHELQQVHPRLIVLSLSGYADGVDGGPAVDSLVQARMGLAFENSTERPELMACPVPTYGAVLQGLIGVCAALIERVSSGRGQVVSTSLQQGGAMFALPYWMSAKRADDAFERMVPKGARPPIVRCADDRFVYIHPSAGMLSVIRDALEADEKEDFGWDGLFGDIAKYQKHAVKFRSTDLLERLRKRGIPCEEVLPPGGCWEHEQVRSNGVIGESSGLRHVKLPLGFRTKGPQPSTALSTDPAGRKGILSGVRVLDFGQYVAGCYPSKVLADLGAEVIKIEPLAGEAMRRASFRHILAVNGGKDGVAIDLKSDEGREIIRRLCKTAHATCHNFRVGVAPRLGLDDQSLRASNPQLVTLEMSAYGASGPKALDPAFDPVLFAYTGHAVRAGGHRLPPCWYRNFLVDYSAGALGAIGLLVGLLEQRTSGRGVRVSADLLGASLFMLSELVQLPDRTFVGGEPLNADRSGFHPAEALYATTDGWIAVAARDEAMAARLAAALDLQLPPRNFWSDAERQAIAARFCRLTQRDALRRLDEADVWAAPCARDGWAAWRDAATRATTPLVVKVEDPVYDEITAIASLVRFSRTELGPACTRTAPSIGRDTGRWLEAMGYSQAEIRDLQARGVVASANSPQAATA